MIIGEPYIDNHFSYLGTGGYDSFNKKGKKHHGQGKRVKKHPVRTLGKRISTNVAQKKQNIVHNFGLMRRNAILRRNTIVTPDPDQTASDVSLQDDGPSIDNTSVDAQQQDNTNQVQPDAAENSEANADNTGSENSGEEGYDSYEETPHKRKHHWFSWLHRKKHGDNSSGQQKITDADPIEHAGEQTPVSSSEDSQDNSSEQPASQTNGPSVASPRKKPVAGAKTKAPAPVSKQHKPSTNTNSKASATNSAKQQPPANATKQPAATSAKPKAPDTKDSTQGKKEDKPADPAQNNTTTVPAKSDNTLGVVIGLGLTALVAGVAIYAAVSASSSKKQMIQQQVIKP